MRPEKPIDMQTKQTVTQQQPESPPPSGAAATLPRVFIIQQPRPKADGWTPSFDSAAKYGGLHYIFNKDERAEADPKAAMERVETALMDFNPEKDYILPTIFGDPATTWVTLLFLGPYLWERGFDTIKFLYWSRGKGPEGMSNDVGYYKPVEVPL